MEKIYDLNNYIQNVTTGGFTGTGIISFTKENKIIQCDSKKLTKCIATYFNILDNYPNLKNTKLDNNLYNSLLEDLENYKKNNLVNIELDNNLKEKLNLCNKQELNLEFNKYMQNSLTNKGVIKYIKELIDKLNIDINYYINNFFYFI